MAHLTEKQIKRIWKNRDDIYGNWIGDDLLIKGCNIGNLDFELTVDDIESESITCGDFDENNYYLVSNVNYGHWYSITEVSEDDLFVRYFYND